MIEKSQHERMKCTLHCLNQSGVKAKVDDIPGTSHNAENEDLSSEERDLTALGEIYVLIPTDAQPRSPDIFVAKVLKYNSDGQTVCFGKKRF